MTVKSIAKFSIGLLIAGTMVMTVPTAAAMSQDDVRRCQAMWKTFGPKAEEVEELTAIRADAEAHRDLMAEAWENAEVMRNFGEAQADAANSARIDLNKAQLALDGADAALRSAAQMYNRDVTAFNQSCPTGD